MVYDERLERDKEIEAEAAKIYAAEDLWREKKEKGECYCKEYKQYLEMAYHKPKDTMCDLCFFKLQDDEDWHHKANFLMKSWAEDGIGDENR